MSINPLYLLSVGTIFLIASVTCQAEPVYLAQGMLAGEVTATTILLQSRLTAIPGPELNSDGYLPGQVGQARFLYFESGGSEPPQSTQWLSAKAENDFIVRAHVTNLQPGTVYEYQLEYGVDIDQLTKSPTGQFETLSSGEKPAEVRFCMGSCMNYYSFMSGQANGGGPVTATTEDKRLGYPVFAAMKKLSPQFFIGTGDIVYYDHPRPGATTLPELRRKWQEQFRFPRLIEFFQQTPAYWSKDDHDFRFNDADWVSNKQPLPQTGIELFREQLPIYPTGDLETPMYRSQRVHPQLQLWFLEGRDFRSPNSMPDGPEKSIWGTEQREWLIRTLQESPAHWKIIVSPTPLVGPDRASKKDNHTNPQGFRAEADWFFAQLKKHQIKNVIIFCGDRHWQYHSLHPAGVEEFSCGALNDENAIRGTYPGEKGSTDPAGLIKQPYHYQEPTGGFLYVTVSATAPARMIIEFRDDLGVVLNRVEKYESL